MDNKGNETKKVFHIDEISTIFKELIVRIDAEMDLLASSSDLDIRKIRMFCTERSTIKRMNLLLIQKTEE